MNGHDSVEASNRRKERLVRLLPGANGDMKQDAWVLPSPSSDETYKCISYQSIGIAAYVFLAFS